MKVYTLIRVTWAGASNMSQQINAVVRSYEAARVVSMSALSDEVLVLIEHDQGEEPSNAR